MSAEKSAGNVPLSTAAELVGLTMGPETCPGVTVAFARLHAMGQV